MLCVAFEGRIHDRGEIRRDFCPQTSGERLTMVASEELLRIAK
jgi:hypothetical protein